MHAVETLPGKIPRTPEPKWHSNLNLISLFSTLSRLIKNPILSAQ